MKTSYPEAISANGFWNPFTGRKRYTLLCECGYQYSDKVLKLSDLASSLCPACGVMNQWLHSEWDEAYKRHLAERRK